jgi:hypothetical protein
VGPSRRGSDQGQAVATSSRSRQWAEAGRQAGSNGAQQRQQVERTGRQVVTAIWLQALNRYIQWYVRLIAAVQHYHYTTRLQP